MAIGSMAYLTSLVIGSAFPVLRQQLVDSRAYLISLATRLGKAEPGSRYILAFGVTVIELVFNNDGKKHTLTLFAAGVGAYLYGVYTNIVGFWLAQGSPPLGDDPLVALGRLLLPVGFGLFIEIVPEPLFLWGIGKDGGDVLGHIFGGMKRPRPPFGGGAEQSEMFGERPSRPRYRPQH